MAADRLVLIDTDGRPKAVAILVPVQSAGQLHRLLVRAVADERSTNGIAPAAGITHVMAQLKAAAEDFLRETGGEPVDLARDGRGNADRADRPIVPTMSTAEAAVEINRTQRHVRNLFDGDVLTGHRTPSNTIRINQDSVAEYLRNQ